MALNEEAIWEALRSVKDPETNRNVVALNMIRDLVINEGSVSFRLVFVNPASPVKSEIETAIKHALIKVPGVKKINVDSGQPQQSQLQPKPGEYLSSVQHIIAVASTKGGVGKSTVSVNLAAALAATGARVGLLDADIYGPNIPLMSGAQGAEATVAVYTDQNGQNHELIEPIEINGMKVMSMGFLVHDGQPVMWRGPMLNSALKQFLGQVDWGELDYLVIDLPPGTGDVQLSLLQLTQVSGIVHVTTPQEIALQDVRRGIAMFASQNIPVLGVIENMSFFCCPNCGHEAHIFSSGGADTITSDLRVPLLGKIPLAIEIREAGDTGKPFVLQSPDSPEGRIFTDAAQQLIQILNGTATESFASSPDCGRV